MDSGASVHMLSRMDVNAAALETVRASRNPTKVKDLDLFVTVQQLEDSPLVLSLGQLCEDHGFSFEWTDGQKNNRKYNAMRTTTCPQLSQVSRADLRVTVRHRRQLRLHHRTQSVRNLRRVP